MRALYHTIIITKVDYILVYLLRYKNRVKVNIFDQLYSILFEAILLQPLQFKLFYKFHLHTILMIPYSYSNTVKIA